MNLAGTHRGLRARRAVLLLSLILLAIGSALVWNASAWSATQWMFIYSPADFPTAADLATFLKGLRIPVPPVIATLEIISFQLTGSTALVTTYLYRASLVGAYLLALWFAYPSVPRLCASFLAAVIFLWATTLIHPLNPQVYDLFLAVFVLLFAVLLKVCDSVRRPAALYAVCLSLGFVLSMAELVRPFVLALLPVFLLSAYLRLRQRPRRFFLALLVPLCLFSGVWHLHLALAHGQVLWTNHSGFNLVRAWPQTPLRGGDFVEEVHNQPVAERRWPNLNSEEHFVNSKMLQRAVLDYVVTHPRAALSNALARILDFVTIPTSTNRHLAQPRRPPEHPLLRVYRLVAFGSFLFLFGNVGLLVWYAIKARGRCFLLLADAENVLLLTAFLSLLVLSLGEAREEARLVLSLLPFLAAYPTARPLIAAG